MAGGEVPVEGGAGQAGVEGELGHCWGCLSVSEGAAGGGEDVLARGSH